MRRSRSRSRGYERKRRSRSRDRRRSPIRRSKYESGYGIESKNIVDRYRRRRSFSRSSSPRNTEDRVSKQGTSYSSSRKLNIIGRDRRRRSFSRSRSARKSKDRARDISKRHSSSSELSQSSSSSSATSSEKSSKTSYKRSRSGSSSSENSKNKSKSKNLDRSKNQYSSASSFESFETTKSKYRAQGRNKFRTSDSTSSTFSSEERFQSSHKRQKSTFKTQVKDRKRSPSFQRSVREHKPNDSLDRERNQQKSQSGSYSKSNFARNPFSKPSLDREINQQSKSNFGINPYSKPSSGISGFNDRDSREVYGDLSKKDNKDREHKPNESLDRKRNQESVSKSKSNFGINPFSKPSTGISGFSDRDIREVYWDLPKVQEPTKSGEDCNISHTKSQSLDIKPENQVAENIEQKPSVEECNAEPKFKDLEEQRDNISTKDYQEDHQKSLTPSGSAEKQPEKVKGKRKRRTKEINKSDSDKPVLGSRSFEVIENKKHPPNNTVVVRGLTKKFSKEDIRKDLMQCGLKPIDVRLIWKKQTGIPRGFAFVEFTTVAEAMQWMKIKQGVLQLQEKYRFIMQYHKPEMQPHQSSFESIRSGIIDWFCIKCGAQNFKKREHCFKCSASKAESGEGKVGIDEVSHIVTKTLLMRNLNMITNEESVIIALGYVIPNLLQTIIGISIGRDYYTSISRGVCYIGLQSFVDAVAVHEALNNLPNPLTIHGKTIMVSYCKFDMGYRSMDYLIADSFAYPNATIPSAYSLGEVEGLAEYMSRRYATTPNDYLQYLEYYNSLFCEKIVNGELITLEDTNQMNSSNMAAAIAQSAIQQVTVSKNFYDYTHISLPTGTDGKIYPIPDLSQYIYDPISGYQYDPSTGLYYDPNSYYYWNSMIQKFLFWDFDRSTFILAPTFDETHNPVPEQSATPVKVTESCKETSTTITSCSTPSTSFNTPSTSFNTPSTSLDTPSTSFNTLNQTQLKLADKMKARKISKYMFRWTKILNERRKASLAKAKKKPKSTSTAPVSSFADIGSNVSVTLYGRLDRVENSYQNEVQQEPSTASVLAPSKRPKPAAISEVYINEEIIPEITDCKKLMISGSTKLQCRFDDTQTDPPKLTILQKEQMEKQNTLDPVVKEEISSHDAQLEVKTEKESGSDGNTSSSAFNLQS